MHLITTKKATGVISGTQTTENGQIEWSRQLPAHCQLSDGMKQLVTPLLAGLLEVCKQRNIICSTNHRSENNLNNISSFCFLYKENQIRMWSFDRFFKEVTHILSKKVLNVFYVNRTSSIEVFINEGEDFFHLKEYIRYVF